MLQTSMGISVGVVVTLLVGFLVGPLLRKVEDLTRPPEPQKIPKDVWGVVMARSRSGPILGVVEQLIFFISLWTGGWPLLASWLAFKVASKWQSWTHIAQLPAPPSENDKIAQNEYVIFRHKWVAQRYMTFVLGTGANIVSAAFGVAIGNIIVMSS